ncbi:IS4/Tn5 family transposase DNA-binding protein [Planctomicrobium sp. SH527]|uniref:IS4/Tn5 family transposase DNA-binding protein n=1 Tax=Planctomicrobium sp. SH527 TaxID=3448123 RepID=UPI003F5C0DAE
MGQGPSLQQAPWMRSFQRWPGDTGRRELFLQATECRLMDVVPQEWAAMEFSTCQLGDKRRTDRLIKAAAQVLARPDGSTPRQIESWSDCKALYRLMDCEEVSLAAITAPHYERTRQTGGPGETYLILNDTTEINYGGKRNARGLGLVGKNTGRGFFLHSALLRDPVTQQVIGLAGQEILYRKGNTKKGAKNSRRRDADRESAVWGSSSIRSVLPRQKSNGCMCVIGVPMTMKSIVMPT